MKSLTRAWHLSASTIRVFLLQRPTNAGTVVRGFGFQEALTAVADTAMEQDGRSPAAQPKGDTADGGGPSQAQDGQILGMGPSLPLSFRYVVADLPMRRSESDPGPLSGAAGSRLEESRLTLRGSVVGRLDGAEPAERAGGPATSRTPCKEATKRLLAVYRAVHLMQRQDTCRSSVTTKVVYSEKEF